MKLNRQPYFMFSHTNSGGPIIEATFVPALKMPVAKARSFFGNHSATAFTAAGKLPASPNPSIARQNARSNAERDAAWNPAAIDHHTIAVAYPMRVPKRSM